MSKSAEIRFVQVKMGLTPGWCGGTRLVRLLGKQQALQLLGKGQKVDLSYGRQLGLVDGELPTNQVRLCCEGTFKRTLNVQRFHYYNFFMLEGCTTFIRLGNLEL